MMVRLAIGSSTVRSRCHDVVPSERDASRACVVDVVEGRVR